MQAPTLNVKMPGLGYSGTAQTENQRKNANIDYDVPSDDYEPDIEGDEEAAIVEMEKNMSAAKNKAVDLATFLNQAEVRLSQFLSMNETLKDRLIRARAATLTSLRAQENMQYYCFYQWRNVVHEAQIRGQRHAVKLSIRVDREQLIKRIVELEQKVGDAQELSRNLDGEMQAVSDVVKNKQKELFALQTASADLENRLNSQDKFIQNLQVNTRLGIANLDKVDDDDMDPQYMLTDPNQKLADANSVLSKLTMKINATVAAKGAANAVSDIQRITSGLKQ